MIWDYCEVYPFSYSSGNYDGALEWVAKVAEAWPGSRAGQVQLADAANNPLPDQTAPVWFSDPPYYDAVPYAHLSDFFYVWIRRILGTTSSTMVGASATPKDQEIVVDRPHSLSSSTKDLISYERGMASAFAEGRRVLREDGIGSVVFAHKTTEGWEALLSGIIRGGWTITGSWPVATEMGARLNARETASLATSVHLICCPRPDGPSVGDWTHVLRELPLRVDDWMERLQNEGIRGADLVFACIGPALEIFSRYSKVETAEGQEVQLPQFLEKVWEVVGRTALEQILGTAETKDGGAGALEEDARLTALFLWTLQSTDGKAANDDGEEGDDVSEEEAEDEEAPRKKPKGFSLIFDVVRRFAQPLGIHLPDWEDRIIETEKGIVRLLPVGERARQLFGEEGASVAADRLENDSRTTPQLVLFPAREENVTLRTRGRGKRAQATIPDESLRTRREATTLDRVHAAMLLQAGGRANALRALLKAEQERSPDFLRLANALSALYPKHSEEKRLLDAMLLAMPR
jgi:hypothetical protein